jgi:ABC-2 type transport system ATP-binding protein
MGVQLQASAFFDKLTAREQLETFGALYGVKSRRVLDMLELVAWQTRPARRTPSFPVVSGSGCRSPAR